MGVGVSECCSMGSKTEWTASERRLFTGRGHFDLLTQVSSSV